MIFAYIRVSSDKQTNENQRYEITQWCKKKGFFIEQWFEETISSRLALEKRYLFQVIEKLRAGDTLIVSALSRIGRNLMEVMGILNKLLKREVKVLTVQEGYELGDNITSKVMAFAFGIAAEIEREMISLRTKEGLRRRQAEGQVLGRPKGSTSSKHKLTGKEDKIKELLKAGISVSGIARLTKTHRLTVSAHIINTPELYKLRPIANTNPKMRRDWEQAKANKAAASSHPA